ncbi:Na+/H+ antiporter subunit E [Methanolobus sp. ZRKC3]|uniref:Na+/H+ antiporter subunit E n=1 Tax=Methanolobus sp. ZRKC3 TaxID=3125786 RepID=UPI00324431A4
MKKCFIYSIALGFIWCFVSGNISPGNFLIGTILGYLLLRPLRVLYDFEARDSLVVRLQQIPKQIKYFSKLIVEIIKASIAVAKIIIQPNIDIKPGIISVPISAKTNVGITAIANTITLTPGTLTIDVSDDRSTLYVHCIDIDDSDKVRDSIREELEEYVLEAFE